MSDERSPEELVEAGEHPLQKQAAEANEDAAKARKEELQRQLNESDEDNKDGDRPVDAEGAVGEPREKLAEEQGNQTVPAGTEVKTDGTTSNKKQTRQQKDAEENK